MGLILEKEISLRTNEGDYPTLIPPFVSSLNRAEDLATAMEARGYQGGDGRSKYRTELRNVTPLRDYSVAVTILLFVLKA